MGGCKNDYLDLYTVIVMIVVYDSWRVDKHRMKFKAAPLHVGVVPFFFGACVPSSFSPIKTFLVAECFQTSCLDFDIQTRLFHVFGSILSGCQVPPPPPPLLLALTSTTDQRPPSHLPCNPGRPALRAL